MSGVWRKNGSVKELEDDFQGRGLMNRTDWTDQTDRRKSPSERIPHWVLKRRDDTTGFGRDPAPQCHESGKNHSRLFSFSLLHALLDGLDEFAERFLLSPLLKVGEIMEFGFLF